MLCHRVAQRFERGEARQDRAELLQHLRPELCGTHEDLAGVILDGARVLAALAIAHRRSRGAAGLLHLLQSALVARAARMTRHQLANLLAVLTGNVQVNVRHLLFLHPLVVFRVPELRSIGDDRPRLGGRAPYSGTHFAAT